MICRVSKSSIGGAVSIPTSKSMMQRACALALLHCGTTIIKNPGLSKDDLAALVAIEKLGAKIEQKNGQLIVHSKGKIEPNGIIDFGESGLSSRMFAPIIALSSSGFRLTASGSLLNRPMAQLIDLLESLGVDVSHANGKFPLTIKGPMHIRDIEVDGSLSSQYITGLLMSYAFGATEPTQIIVKNIKSKPYLDLTVEMLQTFGAVIVEKGNVYHIYPKEKIAETVEITLEGDWSGAVNFIVAACIAGSLQIRGLAKKSLQADSAILDVLTELSVQHIFEEDRLIVEKADELYGFSFDATHCPDLFPPLVALAAYCKGKSVITGVHRLRDKESDRAVALVSEFGNLGVEIVVEDDTMHIAGNNNLHGAVVSSHNDHRIAMALAIAALGMQETVEINGAEAVQKSYPNFWSDLQKIGAKINFGNE